MQPYVLIIDDDPLHTSAIARQLQAAGLRTRTALDSVTALAEIDGEKPDLILLDVNMPGIDGIDLCRYIKTRCPDLGIATLILTALDTSSVRTRALESGADGFLTKPLTSVELLAEVRDQLARAASRKAAAGTPSGEQSVAAELAVCGAATP
jgi:DNA-binding response OmpR family regulator